MIDDKTIKSLYDDKPTLLEWLKRVEAQLEELKKITNFDTLTAEDATIKTINGTDGEFAGDVEVHGEFLVGGNPTSKAIYVHKLGLRYRPDSTATMFKYYLSTNSNDYDSLADIFAHEDDTSLGKCELFEYKGHCAIFIFTSTGSISKWIEVGASSSQPVSIMNGDSAVFVNDEVVGYWR